MVARSRGEEHSIHTSPALCLCRALTARWPLPFDFIFCVAAALAVYNWRCISSPGVACVRRSDVTRESRLERAERDPSPGGSSPSRRVLGNVRLVPWYAYGPAGRSVTALAVSRAFIVLQGCRAPPLGPDRSTRALRGTLRCPVSPAVPPRAAPPPQCARPLSAPHSAPAFRAAAPHAHRYQISLSRSLAIW